MSRLRFVEEVESTNSALLADREAVDGEWLIAKTQRGGRGRQGRDWQSLLGNFHGSVLIIVRPGDPPATLLSLACGIALYEAVAAIGAGLPLSLKWPNDLMLRGAKLAGILIEREGERVVAGFGVNLAQAPAVERAAAALPNPVAPEAFAPLIAGCVDRAVAQWRENPEATTSLWLERAHRTGTALTVHAGPTDVVSGTFAGVGRDGALLLALADGATRVIHAGDAILG